MNQITLLEFCQVPENRIKLMEYLIQYMQYELEYYICWIINYDSRKFKQDNNIDDSEYCIGLTYKHNPFNSKTTVLLSDLLPELVKYKHIPPSYITDQEVWFYSTNLCDGFQARIEALTKAINDIKNNLS